MFFIFVSFNINATILPGCLCSFHHHHIHRAGCEVDVECQVFASVAAYVTVVGDLAPVHLLPPPPVHPLLSHYYQLHSTEN